MNGLHSKVTLIGRALRPGRSWLGGHRRLIARERVNPVQRILKEGFEGLGSHVQEVDDGFGGNLVPFFIGLK